MAIEKAGRNTTVADTDLKVGSEQFQTKKIKQNAAPSVKIGKIAFSLLGLTEFIVLQRDIKKAL